GRVRGPRHHPGAARAAPGSPHECPELAAHHPGAARPRPQRHRSVERRRARRTHDGPAARGLRPDACEPPGPADAGRRGVPVISGRTKIPLLSFGVITLLGVSFVGARSASLDRAFYDDNYTVTVHLPDSGGIFSGGQVTYRGVNVGKVHKLVLTDEGVD